MGELSFLSSLTDKYNFRILRYKSWLCLDLSKHFLFSALHNDSHHIAHFSRTLKELYKVVYAGRDAFRLLEEAGMPGLGGNLNLKLQA